MNSVLKNSRTILAVLFLGAFLTGCNKTDTPAAAPTPDSSSTAPAATPAPDTSSAAPSDSSSTMASDAHAAVAVVDDTVITGKIKTALLADESVKGLEIHVDTKAGDVSLSGTVENQTQIDNALRIAHGVEGVKNVNNALVIKAG